MKTKFTKRQWWIGGAVVFILTAVFFVTQVINAPKNLGTEVKYIGTKNIGCEWWQIPLYMGWCQGPSYYYYFVTDMDEKQLEAYFKNASIELVPQYDSTPPYPQVSTELRFHVGKGYATAMYYSNAQSFLVEHKLKSNDSGLHAIELDAASYEIIKNSY